MKRYTLLSPPPSPQLLISAIQRNYQEEHYCQFASQLLLMALGFLTRIIRSQVLLEGQTEPHPATPLDDQGEGVCVCEGVRVCVCVSSNLHCYAPLEVIFSMVSFFLLMTISGQKPWTIVRGFDRNRGHSLWFFYSSLEGTMILFPLRCGFAWYHVLPKSKFSDSGRKPWTIVRGFDHNSAHYLRSFYSSLEGAM